MKNFSALLMRSDGSVLVRYPPLLGPLVFSADRPVMQAIAAEPDRGLFRGRGGMDGIERLFGYQRIGGYPLYVAFGIPRRGMFWLRGGPISSIICCLRSRPRSGCSV